MKNLVSEGKVLRLTAPSGGVTSGNLYIIGALAVVAAITAAETLSFDGYAEGVFSLPKTSAQAWTEGQKIYWDAGNSRCDSDPEVGKLIGVAAAAADNPSATGNVRLNGVAADLLEGTQDTIAAVAEADADGTYGAPEAALINELKTKYNLLLAACKAAGIVASA